MNKKIQKILEKEGPVIQEFESAAFFIGLSVEATKTKLEVEMDKRCGKLGHFYTSDLNGTSLQLEREETDIEKRILQLQRNNIDPDEEDVQRLNLLRIQIRILDYAMTDRLWNHRRGGTAHLSVLRSVARHEKEKCLL